MEKLITEKLSCSRSVMELKIGGYCFDPNGKPIGTIVSVDDENWYWEPLTGLNAYIIYTANVSEDYGCCATLVYAESEEKAKVAFVESFNFSFFLGERKKEKAFDSQNPSFKVMLVDNQKIEPKIIELCSYFE